MARAEKPDVVCLQEIKASIDQLTFELRDIEGYWGHWHGGKGYSGVALLFAQVVRRPLSRSRAPGVRLRAARLHGHATDAAGEITFASIYVPNGGKDFPAKMRFLEGHRDLGG